MKTLIGILVVAIFSITLTLQNVQAVRIKALFWDFESPLALVISVSLILGVIFGVLVSIYTFFSRKNKNEQKTESSPREDFAK
jgi:uncharacterized integral membrane protein